MTEQGVGSEVGSVEGSKIQLAPPCNPEGVRELQKLSLML